MPVAEIIILVFAAIGSWLDVLLSAFSLCMEGSCRSQCCGAEMEHEDAETASRRTASDNIAEIPFTKELKE